MKFKYKPIKENWKYIEVIIKKNVIINYIHNWQYFYQENVDKKKKQNS